MAKKNANEGNSKRVSNDKLKWPASFAFWKLMAKTAKTKKKVSKQTKPNPANKKNNPYGIATLFPG